MKVKIFTDVDKSKMEAQINRWLASTKPEPNVKHSQTVINDVSMPVRTMKGTQTKKVPCIVVTVWYED
jgi:hypothetical protein